MYALTFYSLVLSCERDNYLRVSLSYCPPAYLYTITYSPHSLHTPPLHVIPYHLFTYDIYLTFLLDWHWTRFYKHFLQNNDNTRAFPLPFLLFCICLLSLLFLIFLTWLDFTRSPFFKVEREISDNVLDLVRTTGDFIHQSREVQVRDQLLFW